MKKNKLRFFASLLCVAILFGGLMPAAFAADLLHPMTLTVRVDGGKETEVRACYASYAGNIYASLTDVAAALNGTAKRFSFSYKNSASEGDYFEIRTGSAASASAGGYGTGTVWVDLSRNRLFVDGTERKYYTYRSGRELYMDIADIQLILDVRAEMESEDTVVFYPDESFEIDLDALKEAGYFDYFTGIVVGDADTGKTFFRYNYFTGTSIASTSKLMTYLLVMEAAANGEISLSDEVPVSAYAAKISNSQDGTVSMSEGSKIPIMELLQILLIASSNEAAVALAEYVSGSEAAFVERMNERAQELGLYSSVFYNPNGLPVYSVTSVNAKQQNRMSARDMFLLSGYILDKFPEVTEITSLQFCTMPTLKYTTANSNPLVFNMKGVSGLKTGSTNRAGYCVVVSLPVTANGETHDIVAVVLGAENAAERGQAAELLLHAAQRYYTENGF